MKTTDKIARINLVLTECPEMLDALGKLACLGEIITLFSKQRMDYGFFRQLSDTDKINFIKTTLYYTPFGSYENRPNKSLIKKMIDLIEC